MLERRTGVVTFAGKNLTLLGPEIKTGSKAPEFTVLTPEMESFKLSDTQGKVRVISVVPSIDTPVCDMQIRWFNQETATMEGLLVLSISVDLPFVLKRYCAAKDIQNVKTLSDHKDLNFGLQYGFVVDELRLLARGVLVIDREDMVRHVQYVPEMNEQPDYDKVMEVVRLCLA